MVLRSQIILDGFNSRSLNLQQNLKNLHCHFSKLHKTAKLNLLNDRMPKILHCAMLKIETTTQEFLAEL